MSKPVIENYDALKVWLTKTLTPICDADPITLAKYVVALAKKSKPTDELRDLCMRELDVFLQEKTGDFVDELFKALTSKSYLDALPQQPAPTPVVATAVVTKLLKPTQTTETTAIDTAPSGNHNVLSSSNNGNITVPVEEPTATSPGNRRPQRERQFSDRDNRDNDSGLRPRRSRSHSPNRERQERLRGDDLRRQLTDRRQVGRDRHRPPYSRFGGRQSPDYRRGRRSPPGRRLDRSPPPGGPRRGSPRRRSPFPRRSPGRRSPGPPVPRRSPGHKPRSWSRSRSRERLLPRPRSRSGSRTRPLRSRSMSRPLRSRSRSRPLRSRSRSRPAHSRSRSRPPRSRSLSVSSTSSTSSRRRRRSRDSRGSTPLGEYSLDRKINRPIDDGIFRHQRTRCRDYDEKGFCMRGDMCPYDHGNDPVVVDDVSLPGVLNFPTGAGIPPNRPNVPPPPLPGAMGQRGMPPVVSQSQLPPGLQGPPPLRPPGPLHGPPDGPMRGPPDGPMRGPPDGPMRGPPDGPMRGPPDGPMRGPPDGPMRGPPDGPMRGPPDGPIRGPQDGPMRGPTDGPMRGPPDGIPGQQGAPVRGPGGPIVGGANPPPPGTESAAPPVSQISQCYQPPLRALGPGRDEPYNPEPYNPGGSGPPPRYPPPQQPPPHLTPRQDLRSDFWRRPPPGPGMGPRGSFPPNRGPQMSHRGPNRPQQGYNNQDIERPRDLVTISVPDEHMHGSQGVGLGNPNRTVIASHKRPYTAVGGRTGHDDGLIPYKRKPFQRLGPKHQSDNCTLELRRVPPEMNNIAKINEHFSKFGTINNLQVGAGGDPQAATVTFATYSQAKAAYHSPEPIFNNRLIKVFFQRRDEEDGQQQQQNSEGDQPTKSIKDRLGIPPAHKLTLDNTTKNDTNKSSVGESVMVSSTGVVTKTVFNPAALKKTIHNPGAVVDNTPEARAQKEQQRKEAMKKKADILKQKQELMQKQITQQKLLFGKLDKNKNMNAEDKASVVKTIKMLANSIDKLKQELMAATKPGNTSVSKKNTSLVLNTKSAAAAASLDTSSKATSPQVKSPSQISPVIQNQRQAQRAILDTELEIMHTQSEGGDTSELRKKVMELKREAAALGLLSKRGRGRGGMTPSYRGRGRGRGFLASMRSVDRRPRQLLVTGFTSEEQEEIAVHFESFGPIESSSYDPEANSFTVTFKNRATAEMAFHEGVSFNEKRLSISWQQAAVTSSAGAASHQETVFTSTPKSLSIITTPSHQAPAVPPSLTLDESADQEADVEDIGQGDDDKEKVKEDWRGRGESLLIEPYDSQELEDVDEDVLLGLDEEEEEDEDDRPWKR